MHMIADIEIFGENPIRTLDLATNEAMDIKKIEKIDDMKLKAIVEICVPRRLDCDMSKAIAQKLLESNGVNVINIVPNAE